MKNDLVCIKRTLTVIMVGCFALAAEFKDVWWAFSGLGAGLLLAVVYLRGDGHTFSWRAIFFAIAPLAAIPVLLQAGAGIFAFMMAGAMLLVGEHLRKHATAKRVSITE